MKRSNIPMTGEPTARIPLFWAVTLLVFSSCVSRGGKAMAEVAEDVGLQLPYTISLEYAIDNPTPIGISEIAASITYLPLETSRNSLLKEGLIVEITDSMIFVSDNAWQLMTFDRQGKFLRRIGRVGNGPGEHLSLLDLSLSPDEKRVSFLDENRGIFEYDLNGTFLNNYPVPREVNGASGDFMVLDDESFIFGCGNFPADYNQSEVKAFILGRDGTLKKTYKTSRKRNTGVFFALGSLYPYEGNVRYQEQLCDTLYTLTRDSLIPYAIFDLGAKGVDPERFFDDNFTNMHGFILRRVNESSEGLYFDMADYASDNTRYGYFDKLTGESKIIGGNGFANDIDGGLPFFPKYVSGDDMLVSWVNAYTLKEHVEALDAEDMTRLYGNDYTRLAALAAGLKDDDNPVIIFAELK